MLVQYKNVNIFQGKNQILKDVSFQINEGEFVYLTGKIGSGKTSLLRTVYADLNIHSGEAKVLDFDMQRIKRRHVPTLRKQLGIVFQDFQLLHNRTVFNNLDFVLKATGWKKKEERKKRIAEVAALIGMDTKMDKFPHELSGGEQQRVTIARAFLNHPKLIIADEPTARLDNDTCHNIMDLLKEICKQGTTIVMSTHNHNLLNEYPGRVFHFEDGQVTEITAESPTETVKEEENA